VVAFYFDCCMILMFTPLSILKKIWRHFYGQADVRAVTKFLNSCTVLFFVLSYIILVHLLYSLFMCDVVIA